MHQILQEHLPHIFFSHPAVAEEIPQIKKAVDEGTLLAANVVQKLLKLYYQ